jgi:hypothetical protein
MTGPGHYQEAERLLLQAANADTGSNGERYSLAAAQVHATLALAAATALNGGKASLLPPDWGAWHEVAGCT